MEKKKKNIVKVLIITVILFAIYIISIIGYNIWLTQDIKSNLKNVDTSSLNYDELVEDIKTVRKGKWEFKEISHYAPEEALVPAISMYDKYYTKTKRNGYTISTSYKHDKIYYIFYDNNNNIIYQHTGKIPEIGLGNKIIIILCFLIIIGVLIFTYVIKEMITYKKRKEEIKLGNDTEMRKLERKHKICIAVFIILLITLVILSQAIFDGIMGIIAMLQ